MNKDDRMLLTTDDDPLGRVPPGDEPRGLRWEGTCDECGVAVTVDGVDSTVLYVDCPHPDCKSHADFQPICLSRSDRAVDAGPAVDATHVLMRHRPARNMKWTEVWVSFPEAARMCDSGFMDVEFGEWVVDFASESIRAITAEDKEVIAHAADEYSVSK